MQKRKKLNHHKEIAHLPLREYTQPMFIFKEIHSKSENRPYVHPYADILGWSLNCFFIRNSMQR